MGDGDRSGGSAALLRLITEADDPWAVWAEVRTAHGIDLRDVGEEGGPDPREALHLVRHLVRQPGTACWAAAEGDLSLIGLTRETQAIETLQQVEIAIAYGMAGKRYDPKPTDLEQARQRRSAREAMQQGADAVARFFGVRVTDRG